jgi:uncharacterized protein (TIGR03437 family)
MTVFSPASSRRGGSRQNSQLDSRLEDYFATLRYSSVKERLKRSMGNWHLYAAVTSSAMAMATNASASIIGNRSPIRDMVDPIASARSNKEHFADPRYLAFKHAVRLGWAENRGAGPLGGAGATVAPASQTQTPSIPSGGVVAFDSTVNVIQPGEWVSIYGSNLAAGTAYWNGDFPTSLGGTSVQIDGKDAYLMYVSPGQINLQAPDDTATGMVSVVVTTAAGQATSTVTLNQVSPSFALLNADYVAGIILRPNHSGAFGGGSYDILGPTGTSFGYQTVAAQAGDSVELYAVGLGPTNPLVPAGMAYSGAAPITGALTLYINNVLINPTFVGLTSAGLYQLNFVVPVGLGQGNVAIEAMVDGMSTQKGAVFSLQSGSYPGTTGGTGGTGTGPFGFGTTGGTGGTGGGGSAANGHKPYLPKLRF